MNRVNNLNEIKTVFRFLKEQYFFECETVVVINNNRQMPIRVNCTISRREPDGLPFFLGTGHVFGDMDSNLEMLMVSAVNEALVNLNKLLGA